MRPVPKSICVRTWEPQQPISTAASVIAATDVAVVRQTTAYVDGLGRPLQSVIKGINPQKKDLVSATLYDEFGRERYNYLSYASPVLGGNFKNNPFTEQQTFYINLLTSDKNNEDDIFYGEIEYEGGRVLKTMAPGSNWQGAGRGISQQHLTNVPGEVVRIWQVGAAQGAVPTSPGVYLPGELKKSVVTDEAEKIAVSYVDKFGKAVMKKVRVASGYSEDHDGWLCTYYIYDDWGNVRMALPPKAVEWLKGNGWNLSNASFRKELCFTYEFDAKGRVIKKQAPGTEPVEFVYDSRDRLVLTRDGRMRASGSNQWMATIFDDLNRPVITGLYTTIQTHQQLQDVMNTVSGTQSYSTFVPGISELVLDKHESSVVSYKARQSVELVAGFETPSGTNLEISTDPSLGQSEVTYVSLPLPGLNTESLYALTYYYYDNYQFSGAQNSDASYFNSPKAGANPNAEAISVSNMVYGAITGTKVRVLETDQWLTTTRYYDAKGRVVQTISDAYGGGKNVMTQMYDFSGKQLSSYQHHYYPRSSLAANTKLLTMMEYDHAGRITRISKQVNDNAALQRDVATISFDALGQMEKKEFKKSGGAVIESLNYDYNIRGWLKSINRKYLRPTNPEPHFFAEEIHYDYGFQNKEYNGTIAGITWKGFTSPESRSYAYTYDRSNRILQAYYTQLSGSQWNRSANVIFDMKVGDGADYSQAYDPNGNIKRLQHWGIKGVSTNAAIDDLSYAYKDPVAGDHTNKLQRIADGVNDPSSTLGDFLDHNPLSTVDYGFDENGNMLFDQNKKITGIQYNFLNLPKQLTIAGKGTISFVYDALGRKLAKTVIDQSTATPKTTKTDYRDGLVFENDELEIINHEEGRIRVVRKTGQPQAFYYDYFLKDHLGNIRTVLTEQTDFSMYQATMETARAVVENSLFSNVDASRVLKPAGYPENQAKTKNEAVAILNGNDPEKRIGPSLVLKVMAGDTINIGVKAFYKFQGPRSTEKVTIPAADMATALVRAFGGGSAAAGDVHGAPGQVTFTAPFNSNFVNGSWNRMKENDPAEATNSQRPRAFLNYVLFDEQFNLVENSSGVRQVAQQPDELQTLAKEDLVADRSGFLYIYTSNETPQDVYFDDLTVTSLSGPVLEESHYYPHGLLMAGISTRAPNRLKNNFLYNGKELNANEFADGTGLEWYDYGNREYDPQIGRFFRVDPLVHDYTELTPYQYAGNDPVKNIDLDGLEPKTAYESWNLEKAHSYSYGNGQKVFFIEGYWVNMQRGAYNGVFQYYNKKNRTWEPFTARFNADDYRSRAKSLTEFSSAMGTGMSAILVAGAGATTGLLNLQWYSLSGLGASVADAGIQLANSEKSTFRERVMDLNLTSIAANYFMRNPAGSGFVGSAFEYKPAEGFQNSILAPIIYGQPSGKSDYDLFIETSVGTVFGFATKAGTDYLQIDEAAKMAAGLLQKSGKVTINYTGAKIATGLINQLNTMITNLLKTLNDENNKKDRN